MERETTILVRVEEADKSVGLILTGSEVSVVSQVVEKLMGSDVTIGVAVEALEGRVRSKVSDGAETSTGSLELSLSVTNSDEKVLKSVFRFVAKHLSKHKLDG